MYILTSMFPEGIHGKNRALFQTLVTKWERFAFVASEFEKDHEATDSYYRLFLHMLEASGIHFENSCVVDGRMTGDEAKRAAARADCEKIYVLILALFCRNTWRITRKSAKISQFFMNGDVKSTIAYMREHEESLWECLKCHCGRV